MNAPALSAKQIVRSVVIALVVGGSLGIAALSWITARRLPQFTAPESVSAALGTADHWQRIRNIGSLIDAQALDDNSVWAVFEGGVIARLDNNSWTQMPDQVTGDALTALSGARLLVTGGTRMVWLTADRGANWQPIDLGASFDPSGSTTNSATNTSKPSLWPLIGQDGTIWLISDTAIAVTAQQSLTAQSRANWKTIDAPPGLVFVQSESSLAARDGSLWITLNPTGKNTANALSTLWHYTFANGWQTTTLIPRTGVRFLEDAKGGIWIALADGGAAHFDGVSWHSFTANSIGDQFAAPDRGLEAGVIDADNNVWWSDSDGSLHRYDGQNWIMYAVSDSAFAFMNADSVPVLDSSGHVWVSGDYLAQFANGGWRRIDPVHSAVFDTMHKTFVASARSLARDGSLWFSVSSAGVVRYDGVHWTWFGPENGTLPILPNSGVHDAYIPLTSTRNGGMLLYHAIEHATYRYTP